MRRTALVAVAAIALAAVNLRMGPVNLSPIITTVAADLQLDAVAIGLIGATPPLAFALAGILTRWLATVGSLQVSMLVALALMSGGHAIRGLSTSFETLLLGSALALLGMGLGSILLPPLVKAHFPTRMGMMTAVYLTTMSIGTILAALTIVPIEQAVGWRVALGCWLLFSLAAAVPWAFLTHPRHHPPTTRPVQRGRARTRMSRSPHAWALLLVFAASSLSGYSLMAWLPVIVAETDAGDPATGGALLALFASFGLPSAMITPWLISRGISIRALMVIGSCALSLGYLGLAAAATSPLLWLWVALIGIGQLLFPLCLLLVNLRTRTPDGSARLSAFMQSGGYLLAAGGPVLMGALRQITDGWGTPLSAVAMFCLLGAVVSGRASQNRMLDDEHPDAQPSSR